MRVLRQRRSGHDYVEKLLEQEMSRSQLSPQDRALCQELIYGIVRWQRPLDWLIAQKTQGRTQNLTLQLLLQLGLYQVFWLERIPNHAAVHETVELAKMLGFGAQAGFVNAVLRGYIRERDATVSLLQRLKQSEPALGYSHPDWLVQRWLNRYGPGKTSTLLDWNNRPPPTFARLNSLKTDAATLARSWEQEGVVFTPREWDWTGEGLVFELDAHKPLGQLRSFQEGFFYIQDPSTLLAVRQLDPQPGETILDLCAAPGGKTTYIAQLMRNRGRVVAQDTADDRLALIQENCQRLGVTCVTAALSDPSGKTVSGALFDKGAQESVSVHGARGSGNRQTRGLPHNDATLEHPCLFDRVLVDAPCSNAGVMRRRVDLRWRIRIEEIERLRAAQLELLTQAATRLKPGGCLVYSTCSLEPEENIEVTRKFLEQNPKFHLKRERQLLPFEDGVDGAYVAVMS